jgi:hypothetical protein
MQVGSGGGTYPEDEVRGDAVRQQLVDARAGVEKPDAVVKQSRHT